MAGFQTHITVSSALGAGLAWLGHDHFGLGWPTCAVAGGLCAIGGMISITNPGTTKETVA